MADPASIIMSALALTVSVGNFVWIHLRKVDSLICTLVANEHKGQSAAFQFSFANLGNRPALLRDVKVRTFIKPELHGLIIAESATIPEPRVLKADEVCCVVVEVNWNSTSLIQATREAEARGFDGAEMFFVVEAVFWNPKGEKMIGDRHIATLRIDHKNRSSSYQLIGGRSFRLRKIRPVEWPKLTQKTLDPNGKIPKNVATIS